MRLLDITADVGPGASPATLEGIIRGVRVAVDVARDADIRGIRRGAVEQMKFPTDSELQAAIERFAPGDELGPRYRAERQLQARLAFREEVRQTPPDFWFEWFYRRGGPRLGLGKSDRAFREGGFERLLSAAPLPVFTNAIGLDVLDPILYQALVSDSVARLMPGAVGVRELHYENPFFKRIFGKGTTEQTIATTAQVIEAVSTLGSTRKMAKADAEVAQGTVDDRIEDSNLNVQLKRLKVQREEEALNADRIANARAVDDLHSNRRQREIAEALMQKGLLDLADAFRELNSPDAAALGELGLRGVELEGHYERDDPEDSAQA